MDGQQRAVGISRVVVVCIIVWMNGCVDQWAIRSYNGAVRPPVLFCPRYSETQTGWVFCGIVLALLVVNVFLMDPLIKCIPDSLLRVLVLAVSETPAYVLVFAPPLVVVVVFVLVVAPNRAATTLHRHPRGRRASR